MQAEALEKLLVPMQKQVKSFYGGINSGTILQHDTGV